MKSLHVFHGAQLNNGVERTALTLVVTLKRLGHEPAVVLPTEGPVMVELDRAGVPWQIVPFHCCESQAWLARLKFLDECAAGARRIAAALAAAGGFELLHINTGHGLHAALAAARHGIPALWHIHSPFETDYGRYADFIDMQGYAWLVAELGTRVIAVSNDVKASAAKHLDSEQIDVVFNGIDVEDLVRRAESTLNPRAELAIPPDVPLIVGVGRVSEQKDFATFARVAAHVLKRHPYARFVIAGPLEEAEAVSAVRSVIDAYQLQDRVQMLGARDDVPALLANADVFLSTAIFEGQGLAAIEAMALRRPCVAMACEGLRECIDNGQDGLLVELGDDPGAADAVCRLIDEPDLAARLGNQAAQSVRSRFSSEGYARQFTASATRAIEAGVGSGAAGAATVLMGLLEEVGRARERILQRPTLGVVGRIRRRLRAL